MAQIDPPLLPPRLFRYRDVSSMKLANRELRAISANYLWCSTYRNLNDPMEGFYGVSPWLARQTNFERLSSEILDQKRSVGICCFSDTYDNELMWVHYAKNYSGICVAYSSRQLQTGLNDSVHIVRVAYGGRPPRIGGDHQNYPERAARLILSHKKASWLYEREWRLLVSPGAAQIPGRLKIAATPSVKTVYLGARVKDEIRAKLVVELAKMGIAVHLMKVSAYEHTWVRPKTNDAA